MVNDVEKIGWGAADNGDAEIPHEHDLAICIATGDRNDGCSECFRSIVDSEAAREKPVSVGVLDNVSPADPCTGKGALNDVLPHIDVVLSVGHDNGFAGGAA